MSVYYRAGAYMAINLVEFGKELQYIRKKCGYTQKEIHRQTSIAVATLRKIENGHHEPRLSTLELLSAIYKVDLNYLVHRFRTPNDFFSDSLIGKTNEMLHTGNIEGLISELVISGESYKDHFVSTKYKDKKIKLFDYFDTLKNLQLSEVRSSEKTIPILETLLFNLNLGPNKILSNRYHFYIETQISIILGISYSDEGKYYEALRYFNAVIESYEARSHHSVREHDFYLTAHLGIMWIDLHKGNNESIIKSVDELLRKDRIQYYKSTLGELFMMKAIAMYKNADRRYYSVAQNLLMYADKKLVDNRYIPTFDYVGMPIDMLLNDGAFT